MAGWYISDDKLPDGGVTKYLKQITEVSCLLQCERDEECDNAIFRLRSKENRLGDCGFVKKDVPDKDGEMQTLQQNEPMSGYKRVVTCPRNAMCHYGQCVNTNDPKGYRCECQEGWILLKRDVCFGAFANQFGTFYIPNNGVMTEIKLQHVGGSGVTCGGYGRTNWGCDATTEYDNRDKVGVAITDADNNVIYPNSSFHIKHGYHSIPGYNAFSPFLIFNSSSHAVFKGQELRLHYAETLFGAYLDNNHGESCADVYAKLCDA